MLAQGVLPFQYESERSSCELTGLAGLPTYFELAAVAGLRESLGRHVCARGDQGWSDAAMVTSLVLLNLAGGDCVDDVEKLAGDTGLCEVLERVRWAGLPRREWRRLERRWRRERTRSVPSASAIRRYLAWFHDDDAERDRVEGTAFIPPKTEPLEGLGHVNADLLAFLQRHRPRQTATLDMDATLVATDKAQALYCYKGYRAYQPLNTWWAEQQVVVHSEFRDGNVPAGYEQLRVLKESLAHLPAGLDTVRMRSDTAGYQWELLRYCEEGRDDRFGRIEFVVGVDVTDAFKQAVFATPNLTWHPLGDGAQEWAEVCYTPQETGRTKKGEYRFVAVREPVRQLELFDDPAQLPFPTLAQADAAGVPGLWKLTAVVTNRITTPAPDVIAWYRDRCGKSEEAHAVMKHDLAGGRMPSKYFGANAAWWAIMILALNLNAVMKRLVLGEAWVARRMKAVRYWLINVPGRVVRRARRLVVRLTDGHRSTELLHRARGRILQLATGPPA